MTDLVTMQVIRYALEQIADEMGHTLVRTGRSTIITEIKDISCVVTDAKGQTVAQAHHTPSLLAGFEIRLDQRVRIIRILRRERSGAAAICVRSAFPGFLPFEIGNNVVVPDLAAL